MLGIMKRNMKDNGTRVKNYTLVDMTSGVQSEVTTRELVGKIDNKEIYGAYNFTCRGHVYPRVMKYYNPNNPVLTSTKKAKTTTMKSSHVKPVTVTPVTSTVTSDCEKYSNKIIAKLQGISPQTTFSLKNVSSNTYLITAKTKTDTRNILIQDQNNHLRYAPTDENNKATAMWKSIDIHNIPRTSQRICKDFNL